MSTTNESALREQGAGVIQGGTCNTNANELPPSLQALAAYPQFICYRLAPSTRPGKMDKLPVSPHTGQVCDAHAPANHASYSRAALMAQILGPDHGVGFVLTAADPLFCLDTDNCLQPDGQWSPLAHELCAQFAGAAVERSVSGKGLHIWGTYAGPTPPHGCRSPLGIELYTERRFIALGHSGATGDARTDCTGALHVAIARYFPPSPGSGVATQELSDGPVPEWRGPTDDDELIRRAMASKSAAAAFGDRASFADLWTANEEALGRAYPDGGGRPYDASAADAALASHLAFWTGRDGARIERLMRQSGLVRDKWDRSSDPYLERTISSVLARGGDVYVDPLASNVPPPPGEPFRMVDLSREFEDAPPPSFVWEGLIPNGAVSILGGHGGTGKSYVALMLAVSVATGRPLYGKQVRQSNVLFYSGEDSAEILTHRLGIVCRGLGIARQELQGRLHIVDASHSDPTLFRDNRGTAATTPAFDSLRQLVDASEIGLLIVDNASEAFDASEIERAKVRAFMRNLKSMVEARNGAVLLLAHIDKNTARMGGNEGYSGSTAWHNSARSRLALKRDEGVLVIEHQKSNFGPLVEPIRLTWATGSIPLEGEDMSLASESGGDDTANVLRLIHEAAKLGNYCAPSPQSPNNVPRVIGDLQGYPRRRKPREVFTLLKHAEQQGLIAKESYRDVSRKPKERWVLTASGIALIQSAPTAPSAPTYQHGAVIPLSARAAPTAPSARGGCGGWSAHTYSHQTT